MIYFIIVSFLVYFLIRLIFCGIVIFSAPPEYKEKVNSTKVIEILTFLWPFFIYIFFKHKLNDDED